MNEVQNNPTNGAPKFFGRRKGRTIRKTKNALLETFLPLIRLTDQSVFDKKTLFAQPVNEVFLEIGFGDGTHLAGQAERNPDIGYIGVEVFQNGVANLLTILTGVKNTDQLSADVKLLSGRKDNIRVFDDDVRLLFNKIPDGFIDRVYLLFPDPWPKKKHASRRFINPQNLKEIARILRRGGILRVATDHPVYKVWTLRTMKDFNQFEWTAKSSSDWRNPPLDWVETKYQLKAVREGRRPVFFEYRRV